MRPFTLALASVCLLLSCLSLEAQPFPAGSLPGPAATQPQTIHLDVLVKDKSGQPVHGLSAQDFTILDNGQAQKLTGFAPVNTQDHPDAVQVVIVVDMINIGYDEVAWAREQIGEFLKQDAGKLGHPTSIAVMTERGLRMMSGSTMDGAVLQASFQRFGTDLRLINRTGGWAALDEMLDTSLSQLGEILAIEQTRPGRKLLLFISPGWPMLPRLGVQEDLKAAQWVFNAIVRLTDMTGDAHTAIYQLHPFGVGRQNPFYYQSFLKPVQKVTQAEYPELALGVFAVHSGGRVVVAGHDIAGEINNALHDAGSYYELTYDPPAPDGTNQFHAISVRVNQPGATAQTLTGYYADPVNVGTEPKPKKK